eukprot:CAMPEP_0184686944 /NCGR_PEP_ID=MMETSP0312-20130426/24660_1 /TAXON_ID=31354 /ORGANISM="Compsopogon coeruleus, Strain SAG 36.94" /LENGTH=365 /DNA_ID=CAMNT_0027142571 /DNA_START=45 /DNA_END=1139 /DNA_ORIENTATION=+
MGLRTTFAEGGLVRDVRGREGFPLQCGQRSRSRGRGRTVGAARSQRVDSGDGHGADGGHATGSPVAGSGEGIQNPSRQRLNVVVTTSIIEDLARAVAGGLLDIHGIVKPGDDPHVYEAVPLDTVRIEAADVVLFNGYNLEANLLPLIMACPAKTRRFPVGESVVALPSEEKGSTVPDPHVWNDARNAVSIARAIADAFAECDPLMRHVYLENAKLLTDELLSLDSWIRKSIQSIPAKQRLLVTTHDAFQYYAKAYGLTIPGTLIGINTEEQPSAKTMLNLIADIRRVRPAAVFFERTVSPLLIKAVAEEASVKLCDESLYSDSVGPKGSGAETYSEMMVYNTKVIVQALGGKIRGYPQLAMVTRK